MIVGKCSLCGGRVSMPDTCLSVKPLPPTCESCGAMKDERQNLPVIKMRRLRSVELTHDLHRIQESAKQAVEGDLDRLERLFPTQCR